MTAALKGAEWSASRSGRTFPPWKDPVPILQKAGWAPGPVWTGGKSRPHRDSIPDLPARSQSLYQLSYPARTHTHTHTHTLIYIYIYIYIVKNKMRGTVTNLLHDCGFFSIKRHLYFALYCQIVLLSPLQSNTLQL